MISCDEFPLKENCDPNDPEEAFLYQLVGPPGMKGAPLPFPVKYLRMVSRRLWDTGARPGIGPELIEYHRPRLGDSNVLFAAGEWKPAGQPKEPVVELEMKDLPLEIRRRAAQQLLENGDFPAPAPSGEPVVPAPTIEVPTFAEKVRVAALAKVCKVANSVVLDVLADLGVYASKPQSTVTRATAQQVYVLLNDLKPGPPVADPMGENQ